jgi:uncharacterized membrane protein (Fun14 family)
MSSEPLLSSIIPFAGSGLLGYAMGFALKKIFKWMLIILGFLAGMFFVGVQKELCAVLLIFSTSISKIHSYTYSTQIQYLRTCLRKRCNNTCFCLVSKYHIRMF